MTLIVLASESEQMQATVDTMGRGAMSRIGEGWLVGAEGPKELWEELVQQMREWEQQEVEVSQEE